MKRILCIFTAVLLMGCGKDGNSSDPENGLLDPSAVLAVNLASKNVKSLPYSKNDPLLKEIIKRADQISFYDLADNYPEVKMGINDFFKDTVNLKINFWGKNVILPPSEGGVLSDFKPIPAQLSCLSSTGVNVVFTAVNYTNTDRDTIAYIPNEIIKSIHKRIKIAFDANDFTECYRIFDTEYVAYPCTSEQYHKLIVDGIEHPYLTGMVPESWYNGIYDDIYPKNSEYWQEFGIADERAQKWHRYWYGVDYTK